MKPTGTVQLVLCLGGVSTELAGWRQLVSFPQNDDKQNWFPAKLPRTVEGSGLAHSPEPGKSQNYLILEARLEQPRIELPLPKPCPGRQLCTPASEVPPLLGCYHDLSYMVHKLCLFTERLVWGERRRKPTGITEMS